MTRGRFFKSLLGLLVAPKLLSEINFDKKLPVSTDACISQIEFEQRYGNSGYFIDYDYVYSVERGEVTNLSIKDKVLGINQDCIGYFS